jgi:transketolase N-terminal domain/subunit
VHPVSKGQGRIARRGAVRAALKSGNFSRAYALADGYLAEGNAPESLKTALQIILEEYTQAVASGFQYASKHHSLREAQGLASRLRAAGAFGLAA